MSVHRIIQIKEKISTAININAMCIPTLVFTFVITEILVKQFQINNVIYTVLMIYGVFTALIGSAFFLVGTRNKSPMQNSIEIPIPVEAEEE